MWLDWSGFGVERSRMMATEARKKLRPQRSFDDLACKAAAATFSRAIEGEINMKNHHQAREER